jgi:iron(III) transport system ATP-binding protein
MTALEVRGLSAAYGTNEVLHDVDLCVDDGVTAILGPSGCGKTTLLRVVAGFVAPTNGKVAVGDRVVVGDGRPVPPRRRALGYVPQEGALFPHLSVAANIAFGLPRNQRRDARGRVAEVLDLVELPKSLLDRQPHELSGGQQQRVALARALAPSPALVLLDEPFSSLDAGLREDTGRAVVRALRATGAAAVLVTHDQGEALSLADQVAVMSEGSFLQVDSPTDVYLSPADVRVAAFLGHASLLPGVIADRDTVECGLGTLPLAHRLDVGGYVEVAVRGEQVQVQAEGPGVPAEVLDVSFFGHDATVRVRLSSGERVVARTMSGRVPRPGDRVHVRVIGDVVAFPEEWGR